jgi:hypothetical protein
MKKLTFRNAETLKLRNALPLLLVLLLFQLFSFSAFQPICLAADNPNEGVTVTTTNTVSVLVATNLVGKTFVFMGRKSSRTNNTGIVWIQRTSTNAFGGIPIYPGQLLSIPVAMDRAVKVDFWITADTSGDGVVWQVYQ